MIDGIGFNNLTLETLAATLNLHLQHNNTRIALGITLTTTLENLQLQLGVRKFTPLYNYDTWSGIATDSWTKSLWGKVDKFGINTELDYKATLLPRENDGCIMER